MHTSIHQRSIMTWTASSIVQNLVTGRAVDSRHAQAGPQVALGISSRSKPPSMGLPFDP